MNWITTNIRFPEDLYLELKLEAAKTRKSVGKIVRERVTKNSSHISSKELKLKFEHIQKKLASKKLFDEPSENVIRAMRDSR